MDNTTTTADESKPWLTFFVDEEIYAVNALETQEVLQQSQVTERCGRRDRSRTLSKLSWMPRLVA